LAHKINQFSRSENSGTVVFFLYETHCEIELEIGAVACAVNFP
jgi:hypothetical protein